MTDLSKIKDGAFADGIPRDEDFEQYEAQSLAEDYGIGAGYAEAGLAEPRALAVIEGEILFYKQMAGSAIVEIGRRLIEAKEQLEHGEWERWLEEKVDFSVRSAQRFMKLAKGYGESDTVTLLGTRKALALLALEDSERSEFLAENDAENMSAAELEQAIRERNEARQEAEQAKADRQVSEAKKSALEAEVSAANSRIKAADAEAAKLRKQIKELESRPVEVAVQTDEKAVEQARQEGIAEGRKEAETKAAEAAGKVDKAMKDLKDRLAKAERESKDAQAQADELQKKLEAAGKQNKLAGRTELVTFNIHFRTAQEQVEEMGAILRNLRAGGETGLADKLGSAMEALRELIGEQMEVK